MKSTLHHTLANQKVLNFAELDTLFSSVCNIVNQRPIAVKNFTEDDYVAITPNDLLFSRSQNMVAGIHYAENDLVVKRLEFMREVEDLWWRQWYVQAFPLFVPFRKWHNETRNMKPGDIVLFMYSKNVGKGDYRLVKVLEVFEDVHKVVRTVKVGFRRRSTRESPLPYISRLLDTMEVGVQRLVVVCAMEEQNGGVVWSSWLVECWRMMQYSRTTEIARQMDKIDGENDKALNETC